MSPSIEAFPTNTMDAGAGGGCNDDTPYRDQSQVTFTALEGEEFIIGIGTFNNDMGSYQITIE